MSLENKLLRVLYDNFRKNQNISLSGKDFARESGVQFPDIYKTALHLNRKGYIEIKKMCEIGRSGLLDIRMAITTIGINHVENGFLKVVCQWILQHLKEIIIGVIIVVVGGIVLLKIEYEIFVPKERNVELNPKIKIQPTQSSVLIDNSINLQKYPKQDDKKLKIPKTKIQSPPALIDNRINLPEYAKQDNNLQSFYEVAKKIFGVEPRNKQFSKIIDIALNEHNLEFAFTVAKDIFGVDPRNAELKKIVIAALKMKRYDFATKVADEGFGADPRNEMFELIIIEKSKDTDTKGE